MGSRRPFGGELARAVGRTFGEQADFCRACQIIGQRERGASRPICRRPEGCANPMPELDPLDRAAFAIFCDSIECIGYASGGMAPAMKATIDWASVSFWAAAHGFELELWLMRRIRACARVLMRMEAQSISREMKQGGKGIGLPN
jgi:hypothetical protein